MENQLEITEKELLKELNDFLLSYNRKISFNSFIDNERYDIEILYSGKKISNFVEALSHFSFIENKIYIPCNIIIKNNKPLNYNILLSLQERSFDLFSINNNNLIKQEIFKDLTNVLTSSITGVYYEDQFNLSYYQERVISFSDLEFISSSEYLFNNSKNLVFINVIEELNNIFKSLIDYKNNREQKSILNFNYNNADSAEYHSKFNELMSKNKKVNKIVNNFIDDCNSFHNKCNVESKANRFSTISNNIKKLLNSKFNKPNSENVIPNYNLVSNRVINSLISDINYNVINENLRNSDLPGLISSDISRNMSYFDTIVTYISVITQTDADSIFVYLSNRFDILNTQVTTFLNYTIYNEYFINTLKDIIDDENYTDQIIIEELESSIIRYINDMNNHDFIINDPEPSTLPI
jgi:hypothetical protein